MSEAERRKIDYASLCLSRLTLGDSTADGLLKPPRQTDIYEAVSLRLGEAPHRLVANLLCQMATEEGVEIYAGGSNGPLEVCTGIGLGLRVSRALPESVYADSIMDRLKEIKGAIPGLTILTDLFPLFPGTSEAIEKLYDNNEFRQLHRLITVCTHLSDLVLREYQRTVTDILIPLMGAQDTEIYIKGMPIDQVHRRVAAALGIADGRKSSLFPSRQEKDPTQFGVSCELDTLAHGRQGLKVRAGEYFPAVSGDTLLMRNAWRLCFRNFPGDDELPGDRNLGPGATNLSRCALVKLVADNNFCRWVPVVDKDKVVDWATDSWGRPHALVDANLDYIAQNPALSLNLAFELVYLSTMRSVWPKDPEALADFARQSFSPKTLEEILLLYADMPETAEKVLDNCASKLASAFSQRPIEALAMILPKEVFDQLSPEFKEMMEVLGINTGYGTIKLLTGDRAPDINKINNIFVELLSVRHQVNPLSYGIDGFFRLLDAFGWQMPTEAQSPIPLFRFFDAWKVALHHGQPSEKVLLRSHLPETIRSAIDFINGAIALIATLPNKTDVNTQFTSALRSALGPTDKSRPTIDYAAISRLESAISGLLSPRMMDVCALVPLWRNAIGIETINEIKAMMVQQTAVPEPPLPADLPKSQDISVEL